MISRIVADLWDAWLAIAPARRRAGELWRTLPGDLLGVAVMRLSGIPAPTRRVALPDGTEALLVEDRRASLYLDHVPLKPYAQTLGRYVVARGQLPDGTIRHELEHVRQWSRLGPLYLMAYGLESMRVILMGGHRYFDNRYELAARSHELDEGPELQIRRAAE